MTKTFRAMQVIRPGVLKLVERTTPEPAPGEVLVEAQACGICGADAGAIEGLEPGIQYPRVPGHEAVGRIAAIGSGAASFWNVGQRVGVGRKGGHCGECLQCRRGDFNHCSQRPIMGSSRDGGYAEMMPARSAGLATFNGLRKSGAQAGDLAPGHLAVQYASRMGFRVVAVGRGADFAEDARRLGAHVYVDAEAEDAVARLKAMGGALVGGERIVQGASTGSPCETERTLDFSVLANVRSMIGTAPLKRALGTCRRMRSGDSRFRMVLAMGSVA